MSTTCQCPYGGQVTCESGQMAVCRTDSSGAVHASCHTPRSGTSRQALGNWALSIVTGRERSPEQPLTSDELEILERGVFRRPNGAIVHFRMPQSDSSPSTLNSK